MQPRYFKVYNITARSSQLVISCEHQAHHEQLSAGHNEEIKISLSFNADPTYVSQGYSTYGE